MMVELHVHTCHLTLWSTELPRRAAHRPQHRSTASVAAYVALIAPITYGHAINSVYQDLARPRRP